MSHSCLDTANCDCDGDLWYLDLDSGLSKVLSLVKLLLGWSLQGKSALNFMHIKSCVSFTKLGTVLLYLGAVVIGKKTPQLKISRVK